LCPGGGVHGHGTAGVEEPAGKDHDQDAPWQHEAGQAEISRGKAEEPGAGEAQEEGLDAVRLHRQIDGAEQDQCRGQVPAAVHGGDAGQLAGGHFHMGELAEEDQCPVAHIVEQGDAREHPVGHGPDHIAVDNQHDDGDKHQRHRADHPGQGPNDRRRFGYSQQQAAHGKDGDAGDHVGEAVAVTCFQVIHFCPPDSVFSKYGFDMGQKKHPAFALEQE